MFVHVWGECWSVDIYAVYVCLNICSSTQLGPLNLLSSTSRHISCIGVSESCCHTCVFVNVCQTWCFQGQSTTARAALGPSVCVCVSVCMWVCDSSCMLPLYTQQEIVCAHVFICLCAHASKQFLHYGHSHTIKCNNICKTNDQQMLMKWQACIEIWEKSMRFWGVLFWHYSTI